MNLTQTSRDNVYQYKYHLDNFLLPKTRTMTEEQPSFKIQAINRRFLPFDSG